MKRLFHFFIQGMIHLFHFFFSAMVNPMLWVVLLTPNAVNLALTLASADIVTDSVSQTQLAAMLTPSPSPLTTPSPTPIPLAAVIQLPYTHAILDYCLQIFTVVLAFVFWVAYLVGDGVVEFSKSYFREDGEARSGDALKCALYSGTALFVLLLTIVFFLQAGHLSVVQLYEPPAQGAHSHSLAKLWRALTTPPPLSSPLTWARGALTVHGLFRRRYQEWYRRLGLEQVPCGRPNIVAGSTPPNA